MYTFCFLPFWSVHAYVARASVCCNLSSCRYLTQCPIYECFDTDTQTQECNTMEWGRRLYMSRHLYLIHITD